MQVFDKLFLAHTSLFSSQSQKLHERLLLFQFLLVPDFLLLHQNPHKTFPQVFSEPSLPADVLQHHLGDLIQGDIVGGTF